MSALTEDVYSKVMSCESANEMWEKLESYYEGNDKVKEAKLQVFQSKFDQLRMSDKESIVEYFGRVMEIVNSIRGLGEKLEEKTVVKKILRTLPASYCSKVSALEERDLTKVTIDELQSTLVAFEMRVEDTNRGTKYASTKEVAFKSLTKLSMKEDDKSHEEGDDVAAFISRNFKKGKGKYKGKLPFKCFKCGEVGHYAANCPTSEEDDSDDEVDNDKKKKTKFQKFKKKGSSSLKEKKYKALKNLLSEMLEGSSTSSEDEADDDISDKEVLAFMAEDAYEEESHDEEIEEGEVLVDFEAEIDNCMEAIAKLKREKKAIKKEKKFLEDENKTLKHENKKLRDEVIVLKIRCEEQVKICDDLTTELDTKASHIEKLEDEIYVIKQKVSNQTKAFNDAPIPTALNNCSSSSMLVVENEEATRKLNECLGFQRPHALGKQGLGFEGDNTQSSKTTTFVKAEETKQAMQEEKFKRLPIFDICGNDGEMKSRRRSQRENKFRGNCYNCGAFGHMVKHCRAKTVSHPPRQRDAPTRPPQQRRILNRPLHHQSQLRAAPPPPHNRFQDSGEQKKRSICYRCKYVGHYARECLTFIPSQLKKRMNGKRQQGPRNSSKGVTKGSRQEGNLYHVNGNEEASGKPRTSTHSL